MMKLKLKIKHITVIYIGTLSLLSSSCFASEVNERVYLTQILNQLDAIQPLIIEAQKEQPINTRIKFHYTKFIDNQGNAQNGLLEDIQSIKQGIAEELNEVSIEPRNITPVSGDYINSNGKNINDITK